MGKCVLAKLDHVDKQGAVYAYGEAVTNMTGQLRIFRDDQGFEILCPPAGERENDRTLIALYHKYRKDFRQDVYPIKLSFQS